jgi:3-deoxy-manno-octulosonate cytidylyltransferase (CMP-KDO synthetase)
MEQDKILIVIPARYASTRLLAKPLQKIAGKELIKRVAEIAYYVCKKNNNCNYVVATDHELIENFCKDNNINAIITSELCKNGTERCWDAVKKQTEKPQLIINLQGDNPLCPPWILQNIIDEWKRDNSAAVYTPCVLLSWIEYEKMMDAKKITPYSGTTVLVDNKNYALAFSKSIIPTLRKIEEAKKINPDKSPVRRHIGLYAYSHKALEQYFLMEESVYEKDFAEGLEQYRFLHNGFKIKMVEVDYKGRETTSGVDSPEDVKRVEEIIAQYGEFDFTL